MLAFAHAGTGEGMGFLILLGSFIVHALQSDSDDVMRRNDRFFSWHLLCAWHCFKYFAYTYSFNPRDGSMKLILL